MLLRLVLLKCFSFWACLVCTSTWYKLKIDILRDHRPCFKQSGLSVENGQTGISCKVELWLFLPNFVRLTFPTNWAIQSTGSVSRKTQSTKMSHVHFEPIASLIPPQNTHPHVHTPMYQVPHSSIIQRRCLGYQYCCFSPQVSVAHS